MTQQLTDTDKRCLEIINNNGGVLESYPSAIGAMIYPYSPGRSDRRWPQGLALCGMRAMRRLESKNIIKIQHKKYGYRFSICKPPTKAD